MAVLIVTSIQQDEHRIRMEKSDVTILVPQINHSWHSIFINSDREKSRAAKTWCLIYLFWDTFSLVQAASKKLNETGNKAFFSATIISLKNKHRHLTLSIKKLSLRKIYSSPSSSFFLSVVGARLSNHLRLKNLLAITMYMINWQRTRRKPTGSRLIRK